MTVDEAISAHKRWKVRLMGYVSGVFAETKLDLAIVARDDACVLGNWLHGQFAAFAADPANARILAKHARFHACAALAVAAADRGDRTHAWGSSTGARSSLGSPPSSSRSSAI
jgi:hypothetical protein